MAIFDGSVFKMGIEKEYDNPNIKKENNGEPILGDKDLYKKSISLVQKQWIPFSFHCDTYHYTFHMDGMVFAEDDCGGYDA